MRVCSQVLLGKHDGTLRMLITKEPATRRMQSYSIWQGLSHEALLESETLFWLTHTDTPCLDDLTESSDAT